MRYDEKNERIEIGVYELVSISRRGKAPLLPRDADEPISSAGRDMGDVTLEFESGSIRFLLRGTPEKIEGGVYTHRAFTESQGNPRKNEIAEARAEAYLLLWLLLSEREGCSDITLNIIYESIETGKELRRSELVSYAKLWRFFESCRESVIKRGEAEIERVRLRLPTMRTARFPYGDMREGQSEFIKAAYRTIAKGGILFSSAPTGTGKTVSALFPAIRALGDGRCEKVFYLTPKSTTAEAARELILKMEAEGVKLRAVILTAKERLCTRGQLCKMGRSHCDALKSNKLEDATHALFDKGLSVVTPEDLRKCARDFATCPHELSLCYAELADIVICDFNYLFAPDVYIRRFFTKGGDYAFLIDEAHNLVERAREMYSAELGSDDFLKIEKSRLFGDFANLPISAGVMKDKLFSLIYPFIKDEITQDKSGEKRAFYHSHHLPGGLMSLIDEALSVAECELLLELQENDADSEGRQSQIREYIRRLKTFGRTLAAFDESYELFIFLSGDDYRIKLFKIDTGSAIREKLALGRSAVFFSGTLSPLDYYKNVLGGDRASTVLELPSPFSREQLAVAVMDKISTRTSERGDSLAAITRVIAATISARRGNYMVFAPSFAYAEALYRFFISKYPKLRTLLQRPDMSREERQSFIDEFRRPAESYLVGFAVMGGIYSEGIDLVGDCLIGTVIVGIGMPALSVEREAIAAYYEEKYDEGKQYAYIYPGMNRVLQAGGRVIRSENDRGVIVLIDDRFDDPIYKKTAPALWRGMKFFSDAGELKAELDRFWQDS